MYIIPLSDINLISSNVAEDEYLEWSDSTTYNTGGRGYIFSDAEGSSITPHLIYESLVDDNTDAHPMADASKWSKIGASNRWSMFDYYINSQTENSDTIEVSISANKCDTVALFGVEATEVTIVSKHHSQTISTKTISLLEQGAVSWSTYFFKDKTYRKDILIDIDLFILDSQSEITISNLAGCNAKCGHCCIGKKHYIGDTLWDVSPGINDYSKKDTNEFGETYLKQGAFAKKVDIPISIQSNKLDYVYNLLAQNRGLPVLWQGNNKESDFESLLVYGFFKSFDIVLSNSLRSSCNIEVEGLI